MHNIKAVAYGIALGFTKSRETVINFFLFPIMALVMTLMIAYPDDYTPNYMFVTMFAMMFAGMILITMTAGTIAGAKEDKSLRLMTMAGVKPGQFLTGSSIVLMGLGLFTTGLFVALLAYFEGVTIATASTFVLGMGLSLLASIFLGATIGIVAKNTQSATATALPIAMVIGLAPTFAMFNDTMADIFAPLYSMQMSEIVGNLGTFPTQSLLIIGANILVLGAIFIVTYQRRGLKGL